MPRLLILLLSAVVVLSGCGDDQDKTTSTGAAEPSIEASTPEGNEVAGCEKVSAPKPKAEGKLKRPKVKLESGKTYVAEVITSCGEFQITLDPKRAPKTGGSFKYLADKGFFDGVIFHRIVPGFVIQGGDPQGTGQGGPGYSVVEAPPEDLTYTKGVVAMAKTAAEKPGTSGSQFFVVTGEDAGLPPEYALLGKVTKGIEVVEKIGVVPTDSATEAPVDPVVIRQIKITEK